MAATPVATFIKDPDAILDYALNWTKWLEGDTISTGVWTVDPGITIASQSVSGGIVTMFLQGGTDATTYNARCRITTTGGRTDDRTIQIQVKEK